MPSTSPALRPRLALVGLLFLFAALVACSAKAKDGKVEVIFWHSWAGKEGEFLDQLAAEFNRTHPGIVVRSSFFAINNGDKLMAAIAGGIPPDVATVWDWMLPAMGEAGCFRPLNGPLEQCGIGPQDFLPGMWECGMFSKHKYGLPTSTNCIMIFYNKALFREAGLDPERPPRTLAELSDTALRLTRSSPGGKLQRIGYVPKDSIIWTLNFGGATFDAARRRFTWSSPENIRALTWMNSFYQRYGYNRILRFYSTVGEYDSPNNPFYTGKIAMLEEGQWQVGFIKQFAPELDYGVFPPIMSDGRPGVSVMDASFWVMPTGGRHPREGWEFLRWLIAPPQAARFSATLYNIPPMKAALESEAYRPMLQTKMKIFIDFLRAGRGRVKPALPMGGFANTESARALEDIFLGKTPVPERLKTLDRQLQRELDKSLRDLGLADPS